MVEANGTVTLQNISSRVQPLAATTRLLFEGVLFRLDGRAPANGTVKASVHADQVGLSSEIAPRVLRFLTYNPSS